MRRDCGAEESAGGGGASLIEVSKLECDGAGEACMGLAWSLDVSSPRIALSGTSGLAYLGELTGAGLRPLATWQAHDVLSWEFTALRQDPPNDPPPVVNGVGAHACVDPSTCVHR